MRRDAVRARDLGGDGGVHRRRLAAALPAIARLAQRRDVVDVDSQLKHRDTLRKFLRLANSAVCVKNPL